MNLSNNYLNTQMSLFFLFLSYMKIFLSQLILCHFLLFLCLLIVSQQNRTFFCFVFSLFFLPIQYSPVLVCFYINNFLKRTAFSLSLSLSLKFFYSNCSHYCFGTIIFFLSFSTRSPGEQFVLIVVASLPLLLSLPFPLLR